MNRRTDAFGGSLENRTCFPRQALKAVHEVVGNGMIIGLRLPGDEMIEGGIDAAEAARIAMSGANPSTPAAPAS